MNSNRDLLGRWQRFALRFLPGFLLARLDPVEKTISAEVLRFARSLAPGAMVLDAGAGECRFRSHFRHLNYVGLDNRQGDPAWDYSGLEIVGNLLDLPLREGSCDAVLNIVVLEHTPDPVQVVREFHRVLRPGGRILLVVPLIWEIHQQPNDYFRFTCYGLERLLSAAGFQITSLLPMGGFFWLLGRYSFYFLKFWRTGLRSVFLPFLAPVFGLLIPLLCYYLDPLDRTELYTLGYVCEARKP